MNTLTRRGLLGSIATLLAGTPAVADKDPVTLFAASSLTDVLSDLLAKEVMAARVSFAASSTLARQIEAGAPADLVMLASPLWMDWLEDAGLLAHGTRRPAASNRLVIVGPVPATAGADPATLIRQTAGRIAVGDPAHVPAGLYAKAALETLGLWSETASRLARTDNTRGTLALVARGEAPLGIVYATDARIEPRVSVLAEFPETSYPPIRYPMAILAGRDRVPVRHLYERILSPTGRAALKAHGFTLPEAQ